MKNELTLENLESKQQHLSTWSKPSKILVKVGSLLDQFITSWKSYEKRNNLDVSKSVRTVFEAKYEVERLIREIGDIAAETKQQRQQNLYFVNALKKYADTKIYLAMSICKSLMDDLIDALPALSQSEKDDYNNFFDTLNTDLK
uniref:CRISPR type III A-associated protein Csm2 n=1 Tax=Panagrellus redivivus TaxID=6233 RepID=A0A7E4VGF5_PANRE